MKITLGAYEITVDARNTLTGKDDATTDLLYQLCGLFEDEIAWFCDDVPKLQKHYEDLRRELLAQLKANRLRATSGTAS